MDRVISFHPSGKRYRSLRIIGALFIQIGAIELAIGGLLLVFGLYTLVSGAQVRVVFLSAGLNGTLSLLWSFAFLLSGLHLTALGGVLRLLVHLEENMRAFAQSLDKIQTRLESRGEGVEPLFRS